MALQKAETYLVIFPMSKNKVWDFVDLMESRKANSRSIE